MLETPHVVVGAAIAASTTNPILGIGLAFASHFVLDMVPHWNPHLNTELRKNGKITKNTTRLVVADVLVGATVGSLLAFTAMPNMGKVVVILLGSFAAVLPDVIEGPYYFFNRRGEFAEKWIKFQKSIQNDTTPLWGILTQLIAIGSALYWAFL